MYANFFVKLFHIIYYLDQIYSIPCKYFNSKITKLRTTSRNDIGYIRYTIYLHDPIIGIYPDKKKKERKENKESISDCIGRSLMK